MKRWLVKSQFRDEEENKLHFLLDENPKLCVDLSGLGGYVFVDGLNADDETLYQLSEQIFALDADERPENAEEIQQFLENEGYSQVSCESADVVTPIQSRLLYDTLAHERMSSLSPPDYFFDLEDWVGGGCDSAFQYWDGHNFVNVWVDNTESVILEIDEQSELLLDCWDGNNWQFNGHGNHASAYKVNTIYGHKPDSDLWLVHYSSQWEGVHDTGELVSREWVDAQLK